MTWTPELEAQAKDWWIGGQSASEISHRLGNGISRSAVIGLAHRRKWGSHAHKAPPVGDGIRRQRAAKSPIPDRIVRIKRINGVSPRPAPKAAPVIEDVDDTPDEIEPLPPSERWAPLPGSTPIAVHEHTEGCRWPIGDDLPFAFCNNPLHVRPNGKNHVYCSVHASMAVARR